MTASDHYRSPMRCLQDIADQVRARFAALAQPTSADQVVVPAEWKLMRDAPRDGRQIIVLHAVHGVIEARFSAGSWSEDTPVSPREYDGAVWVLGDDVAQAEVEEMGANAPEPFYDENIVGWLPRTVLPAMLASAPSQPASSPSGEAGRERAEIVAWLRERSEACRANLPEVQYDEEAYARWLARMEDFAFAAEQIEGGVHE
jgi:hypothetical protein